MDEGFLFFMPARKTKGFADATELQTHFSDHAVDFAALTPSDYEALADAFLSKPATADMRECTRSKGDRVRFDKVTNEYGVIDNKGVIRTYFVPKMCSTLPRRNFRIKCHRLPSNLDYAIYTRLRY